MNTHINATDLTFVPKLVQPRHLLKSSVALTVDFNPTIFASSDPTVWGGDCCYHEHCCIRLVFSCSSVHAGTGKKAYGETQPDILLQQSKHSKIYPVHSKKEGNKTKTMNNFLR